MPKGLFSYIKASDFRMKIFKLLSGSVSSQLILILFSPLLSRIYSPEDFGWYALFATTVSVCSLIVTLRYELAIVVAENEEDAGMLFKTAILFTFLLSILVFFSLVVLSIFFKSWIKIPFEFTYFIAFQTCLVGLFQSFNYLFTRHKFFLAISIAAVVMSIINVVSSLVLSIEYNNSKGLIIANILGQMSGLLVFLYIFLRNKITFHKGSFANVIKQYKKMPLFMLPNNVLDSFSLQVTMMGISKFFSSNDTGQFSFSIRILALPMRIIGMAIGQAFYQHFTELFESDLVKARSVLINTWKKLLIVGMVPFLFLFLTAPWLFSFVFGDNWRQAGIITSVLVPLFFANFITSPTSTAFLTLGLQHYSLFFGVYSILARVLAIAIGVIMKSIYGALLSLVVLDIIGFVVYNLIILKSLNSKILKNKIIMEDVIQ